MGKVFLNKQFSNYLGENRAILDTVERYVTDVSPSPTPSPTSVTPTPTVTPTVTPSGGGVTPSPTPTATVTPSPSVAPVFETEYQAILNRATVVGFTLPGTAQKIKQNQLIVDLKNAGLWSKLGVFYMFKLDTSDGSSPGFTFINWVNPSLTLSDLQTYSTVFPTHTSNSGWTFSQGSYLRLGTNTGTASVNNISAVVSGNSEGIYMVDYTGPSSSGTNTLWSTNNNSWNRARYNNTTAHNIFRGVSLTANYDFTGLGFKTATINGRPDTDTTLVFRNGGVSTNTTKTGVDIGIGGGSMLINGDTTSQTFGWTCGMWFSAGGGTGNGFFSSDVVALETIINAYMTS